MDDDVFAEIDAKIRDVLDEAVAFAEAGREVPPERLYENLYVD